MPELPEVETIVRDLAKSLKARSFARVIVHDAFLLRQPEADFIRRLNDQPIRGISRRGEAIILEVASGDFLVVQLMMTGQFIFNGIQDKHTRLTFKLSDGSRLLYNDQRRFGQLQVVKSLSEIKHFSILGPEPFSKEFTPVFMKGFFKRTSRPIKNLLLDHTFVAGIGNIYACEILFRSLVSPKRLAKKITAVEASTIHQHIIEVLKEAILHRGSSMRNYRDGSGEKGRFNERIAVYARDGLPCTRCGKHILRIVQAGRSTFYCGHCQK